MTIAEQWKKEGRAEGIATGILNDRREVLIRLVSRKFGLRDEERRLPPLQGKPVPTTFDDIMGNRFKLVFERSRYWLSTPFDFAQELQRKRAKDLRNGWIVDSSLFRLCLPHDLRPLARKVKSDFHDIDDILRFHAIGRRYLV